jgi:predicted AAA+ superfamily ATPase
VVHTRNLHNLASDIQRLHIATDAFNQAKTRQDRQDSTGPAGPSLQEAIDEVFRQIDTLQRSRQAVRPSEQQARRGWTPGERPRQRAAQA